MVPNSVIAGTHWLRRWYRLGPLFRFDASRQKVVVLNPQRKLWTKYAFRVRRVSVHLHGQRVLPVSHMHHFRAWFQLASSTCREEAGFIITKLAAGAVWVLWEFLKATHVKKWLVVNALTCYNLPVCFCFFIWQALLEKASIQNIPINYREKHGMCGHIIKNLWCLSSFGMLNKITMG